MICLKSITNKINDSSLISGTADDTKLFACFKDCIIVNLYIIKEKHDRYIYVNKLMINADKKHATIVNLIDRKRIYYDKILIKIKDKKECKTLRDCLKDQYKVAL